MTKKEDKMWKSFEVSSLCREDLLEYITKEQALEIDDDTMKHIARKLGDALMDSYWISLGVIINESEILITK